MPAENEIDLLKELDQIQSSLTGVVIDKKDTTANNPILAAINDLKKDLPKDKKSTDYKVIGDLLQTINKSVKVFVNSNSNSYDIASSSLLLASSFVKALGIIPGASLVTGPLSGVLKLVGSILGKFGNKKETNYYQQLEKIISDANAKQNTEATWVSLKGVLEEMQRTHKFIVGILGEVQSQADIKQRNSGAISVNEFIKEGTKELGGAYENLEQNLAKDKSANWANTAETFFRINEVQAFKALYMLEGVAYHQVLSTGSGSSANVKDLSKGLNDFMETYAKKSERYFAKPSIVSSVITHWIYRMPQYKFNFISSVYTYFKDANQKNKVAYTNFFPNNLKQYRFKCRLHPPECVRLVTLFDRRKVESADIGRRSLTIPKDEIITSEKKYNEGTPEGKLWMAPERYHVEDLKDKTLKRSHFALWADDKSAKDPYYFWYLQSKETHTEYFNTYYIGSPKPYSSPKKNFTNSEGEFYIFYVYPTKQELDNNDKILNGHWSKSDYNPSNRQCFMIGSRGGDKEQIWCSFNDNISKLSAYDLLYGSGEKDSIELGHRDQYLWFLLSENE